MDLFGMVGLVWFGPGGEDKEVKVEVERGEIPRLVAIAGPNHVPLLLSFSFLIFSPLDSRLTVCPPNRHVKRVGTKKDEGADILIRRASWRRERGASDQQMEEKTKKKKKKRRRPKERRAAGRFAVGRACSSRASSLFSGQSFATLSAATREAAFHCERDVEKSGGGEETERKREDDVVVVVVVDKSMQKNEKFVQAKEEKNTIDQSKRATKQRKNSSFPSSASPRRLALSLVLRHPQA